MLNYLKSLLRDFPSLPRLCLSTWKTPKRRWSLIIFISAGYRSNVTYVVGAYENF